VYIVITEQAPGISRRRPLRLPLFALLLLAAALAPSVTAAQTVANPTTLVFTPSPDHEARLSDGRLKIDYYRFDVYAVGASQPFQSTDLGYPTPAADGQIYYNFSSAIASWPLPGGNYEARVSAVGPAGSGTSAVSNPFTFGTTTSCSYSLSGTSASAPAAGGGTQVSVTTSSSCSWTTSSNVSWLTLNRTSGTGSGTVVITVAANPSTSTRTGVVTAAGRTFTVTQAGAAVVPPPTGSSLPSPWQSRDIGSVGLAGSSTYSSGIYSVTGSGSNIWSTADSFQYAYQAMSGNGQIVARVTSMQNTHARAKAGVMLRSDLTAGAVHVVLELVPDGGIELMTRSAAGAITTYLAGSTQAPPAWLRLVRNGTTVTASVSADGAAWRTVGSTTMATAAYAGLAVTSHNTATRNTATFDNVTVGALSTPTGALPSPWASQDIGSVGLTGSATYSSGRFTVTGAGAAIWGTADSFRFAYQALNGDGQIVARVTGLQNTHSSAKAGVMLRSGLTAGAAHVILDLEPSGEIDFMTRPASGVATTWLAGSTQAPPAWLRLARAGSTVTASVSADGTTWRVVGTRTVSMGASVYVGLAVTSHNTAVGNTATFDNVTVR
jgi:regulation of enolase protein 1 (concanavalin A-like superfamily)